MKRKDSRRTEQTLAMIKPDGVVKGLTEECVARIEKAGLAIKERKNVLMDRKLAAEFRKEIREKHPIIFESLIEYMTEGPMVALLVEGEGAIERLREICGPTNPREAPKGTIRGDFAEGDMKELYKQGKVIKNIIHSSGNAEEAVQEIELILGIKINLEVLA